ncbi:MAG: type II secretion system protein [Deltaproteobacteria bacterium]|nr:type II secretion system protein [Deltaproteobacteria bacterium]
MEKKAKEISASKTCKSERRQHGFTLIEVLVVIGIIGLVMSLAIPGIGLVMKANINNSSRELATVIRSAHDESILKGSVYRVAFDLDRGEYWVEVGDRNFLMSSPEQIELERKKNERRSDEEKEKHKDPFQLAQQVTKKKRTLPLGVKFNEIFTSRSKDAIKGGVAYSFVFPFGFIEKTIIHLKDDMERETTLVVSSVTGKSRMFEHYVKDVD